MMKKLIALFLCLMLALPAAAALADDMTTEITLWTFPVGGFGDDEQVQTLIADFNAVYPNIKVNVEYLDYTNGDVQVTTAMEAKTTPDLIFEGPERLVAVYAAAKALAPLDDLWTEEAMADISAGVAAACKAADGVYYEYPLCSTAHCMVIDKAAFEKADALQYIDMEKHTNGRRQILMALASLAGGLLLPGTGRAALQTQEAHHMLVVFYSHTGNTRAIARHIQALTGCDLLDLEPVTPYPRDYDTVVSQAKKEKQQGFLPPLKNPLDMVSRYDVILVGSPSWWGTFAGPVRTFLSTAALDGKTLVPFITHEGSGLGSAPADLRRLCPASQIREGLAVRGSRVDGARQQVESWLRKTGLLSAQ